jgi:hypothetical protein
MTIILNLTILNIYVKIISNELKIAIRILLTQIFTKLLFN